MSALVGRRRVLLWNGVEEMPFLAAGAASWLAMSAVVSSSSFACAMLVVGSLGTACSDVVVDSIVVERCRGAPQVGPSHSIEFTGSVIYMGLHYTLFKVEAGWQAGQPF